MKTKDHAEGIRQRYDLPSPMWDERQRRLWAAGEAKVVGYGGISLVSAETGISRRAIHAGLKELATATVTDRVRKHGAGRKGHLETQPELLAALDVLVEPLARGDPESPLRWSCKRTRRVAEELRSQGFRASHQLVAELLREAGYTLQGNRKTVEGNQHPDRKLRDRLRIVLMAPRGRGRQETALDLGVPRRLNADCERGLQRLRPREAKTSLG